MHHLAVRHPAKPVCVGDIKKTARQRKKSGSWREREGADRGKAEYSPD